MSQLKNSGGQAFPCPDVVTQSGNVIGGFGGMTLRDYFAAHALQGLLADHNVTDEPDQVCPVAYELADGMLRAREK